MVSLSVAGRNLKQHIEHRMVIYSILTHIVKTESVPYQVNRFSPHWEDTFRH